MTTNLIFRNITNIYFDYRREIKKKKNRFKLSAYEKLGDEDFSKENLINENTDIEMQNEDILPPFWIENIEECSEILNTIKQKLIEIQKLQKKKLLNVLNNDNKLNDNILKMSTDITYLIKDCEQKIQNISNINDATNNIDESNNINKCSNIIKKLKTNAKQSLASQLHALSQIFHKNQKTYLKEHEQLKEYNVNLYMNTNENNLNENNFIQENVFEELNQNSQNSVNILKRNKDLKKIADTVIHLHTIFKELSTMLVDQGSMLDQIDYNIELTLDKSEEGLKKLKILEKRENDERAKKIISFLTILIFVLLILIIIKNLL